MSPTATALRMSSCSDLSWPHSAGETRCAAASASMPSSATRMRHSSSRRSLDKSGTITVRLRLHHQGLLGDQLAQRFADRHGAGPKGLGEGAQRDQIAGHEAAAHQRLAKLLVDPLLDRVAVDGGELGEPCR